MQKVQNCSLDKLGVCRYRYLQRAGEISRKAAPAMAEGCALTGRHAEESDHHHSGGEYIMILILQSLLCFLKRKLIREEKRC